MYPDPDIPRSSVPVAGTPAKLERSFFRRHWMMISLVFLLVFSAGGYQLTRMVVQAQTAARRSSAKCTLKGLVLAFHNYADMEGRLPARATRAADGTPLYSWVVPLLPYMDDSELYERINLDQAWNHPDQIEVFKTPARMLAGCGRDPEFCPKGFPVAFYDANSHLLGINQGLAWDEITDGLGTTLLVGEIIEGLKPWGKPDHVRDPALGFKRGPLTFGGPFEGVTQFTFADGSVRAISDDIDPAVLKALATPAAGDDSGDF